MPYTYTELDLGVSQDVSQVCHKMYTLQNTLYSSCIPK